MSNQTYSLNQQVPDFSFVTTNHIKHKISDYLGKNIVLFFYPKDNTPVCTSEAKLFRDRYQDFVRLDTVVFGVSRDDLAAHERFKEKLALPFELISDTTEELCGYFDVIKMKNFFGKKIRGIVRSTFVIDKNGIVRNEWRKIKVNGHVEMVIESIGRILDE